MWRSQLDQIVQGMRRLHYRQVKSSSEIVTQQSFGKSAAVSVCPSVFSGSQSPVCPSIHVSVCPCVRRSVCLCVRVSICPSVRLSVCLSARLFPFIRPSIGVCLSVRLSASGEPGFEQACFSRKMVESSGKCSQLHSLLEQVEVLKT